MTQGQVRLGSGNGKAFQNTKNRPVPVSKNVARRGFRKAKDSVREEISKMGGRSQIGGQFSMLEQKRKTAKRFNKLSLFEDEEKTLNKKSNDFEEDDLFEI